jgi:hypothetical protein
MANKLNPLEDLNSRAKQAVDQTKQQILGAVDNYFDFLQRAISSCPTGGTELGEKQKSYAEKNIAATHEFLHKVSEAKNFQEILLLQSEFMQSQMNELGEQTKSFGEAYSKAAASITKMRFKT